ncbi:hypothetical protein [Pseudonocardia sp. DLS-67]
MLREQRQLLAHLLRIASTKIAGRFCHSAVSSTIVREIVSPRHHHALDRS